MEPDLILPPKPEQPTFAIEYTVILTGEHSGQVSFTSTLLRKADDVDTALQQVHAFISKIPFHMYPNEKGELITPEFPPEFSGRTLKNVSVRHLSLISGIGRRVW